MNENIANKFSKDDLSRVFADNLKLWIEKRDYTQKRLADETGITAPAISQYLHPEMGQKTPSLYTAIKLSMALGCNISDLIDGLYAACD